MIFVEPAKSTPNSTTSDAIQKPAEVTKTPEKKVESVTSPPVTQPSPVKVAVEPKPVAAPIIEKKEEIPAPASKTAAPVSQEKIKETPKPAPVEEPAKNGDTTPVVPETKVTKEPEVVNDATKSAEVVKEVPTVTVTEPTPVKAAPVIEQAKVDTPKSKL